MHGLGEGALIEDRRVEPVELARRPCPRYGAPEIDDALRGGGRAQAGQAFAHHHRHRFVERRVGAVGDIGIGAAMKAVVEHGGQIGGDALHAPRADRLDARLLDRVEQRARRLVLRGEPAMHRFVMAGEPQRHGIGEAAQDRRLARARPARRLGQARLGALGAASQRGLVGGESDFEFRVARHRARAGGDGPLERLIGRLRLAGRLAIGGRFYVEGRHEGFRLAALATQRRPVLLAKVITDRTRPRHPGSP